MKGKALQFVHYFLSEAGITFHIEFVFVLFIVSNEHQHPCMIVVIVRRSCKKK